MDPNLNNDQNPTATPEPATPVTPAPVAPAPAPEPVAPVAPAPAPAAPAPATKNKKKNYLIYACIGAGIIVILAVFAIIKHFSASPVVGDWACSKYSYYSSSVSGTPTVEMVLNSDGTYTYGEYNNLSKNHYAGKYSVTKVDKESSYLNSVTYRVKFDSITEFVSDGVKGDPKDHELDTLEMEIVESAGKKQASAIFENTYSAFSCETK